MLQGICVDPAATTVLEKDRKYFLFPAGANHYYVSRFPNAGSHCGCFRKSLFQIVQDEQYQQQQEKERHDWIGRKRLSKELTTKEDEWPPEPPAYNVPTLDSSKIYKAKLIWTTRAYKTELGTYFLKPIEKNAYVFREYRDKQLKKHVGCFPLHWFTDFREVDANDVENEMKDDVSEINDYLLFGILEGNRK